jgi:hypothetical protein
MANKKNDTKGKVTKRFTESYLRMYYSQVHVCMRLTLCSSGLETGHGALAQ